MEELLYITWGAMGGMLVIGWGTVRWLIGRSESAREKISEKLGRRIGDVADENAALKTAAAVAEAESKRVNERLRKMEEADQRHVCKNDLAAVEERIGKRIDDLAHLITGAKK